MASPSSTSSSRRWPWAGLLAVALIMLWDSTFFQPRSLWEATVGRLDRSHALELGLARDQLEFRNVRERPEDRLGVLVVGSSRAESGFLVRQVGRAAKETYTFGHVAHAGLGPFALRSMVGEIQRTQPDALVLYLSQFDTHRPVLNIPQASYGEFGAVSDLARLVGSEFVFENRTFFYRLLAACSLESYRFRGVLGRSFLDPLRTFSFDDTDRFPTGVPPEMMALVAGGRPTALDPAEKERLEEEVLALFPHLPNMGRTGFNHVRWVTRGDHSRIQQGLLREALERLDRAEIQIFLVEPPLHPITSDLYDVSIRDDFLLFVDEMVERHGVRWVPLTEMEEFVSEDFFDLTHVARPGALKLTREVVQALDAWAAER